MTVSASDIVRQYNERRVLYAPIYSTMMLFRSVYRNEIAVDLPEVGINQKPLAGDIIGQGLDQLSQRVVSTLPDIWCPANKPGQETSEKYASIKRMAALGWWQEANYDLLRHQSARWLIGYGMSPVIVKPDFDKGIPTWEVRDPLSTFPAPHRDPVNMTPMDCIYTYTHTWSWLKSKFPMEAGRLKRPRKLTNDARVTILEYIDKEVHVLMALSNIADSSLPVVNQDWVGASSYEVLAVADNKAGVCWAVNPSRITLDTDPVGQYSKAVNLWIEQSRLMNLAVIAAIKGIFPDLAVESADPNQTPVVNNGGNWKDGRTGEINIVKGGTVKPIQLNPGFMTMPMIDRLEDYVRGTGNVPSELQGDAPTNVRTQRRATGLLGASIDFPIQEYQKIFSKAAEEELRRAIRIAKTYFPSKPKSFFVSFGKTKGQVDYIPSKHFENDSVQVRPVLMGLDRQGQTIQLESLVGTGFISKKTGRKLHPDIDEPEREDDFIDQERMQDLALEGIAAALASGQMGIDTLARIEEVRGQGVPLLGAIRQVQKEVQKEQAAPPEPTAPEAQPGLTPPGAPELATVPPVEPGVNHLAQLFGQLRRPQMTLPSERAV